MTDQDYSKILGKMTIEQKAMLCSGKTNWLTKKIEELGIPSVRVSDGPNGLRREKTTGGVNIMQTPEPATCFPGAVTAAASWDEEIEKEVGKAIGREAKSLGVSTVLGPGTNIKRSPLCGRNFEYFSEDPLLSGKMAAAWIDGVQSENVGTSLKHFLANNQEYIRMTINSIVDERTLREIYMPAFEYTVKNIQPTTVMCSYNRLNGTYLADNKRMLTEVLRDEWGFKGIVMSDWGATNDRVEGIKAGLDLEMPGNKGINDKKIVEAVKNGKLKEEDLDKIVLRMIKFAFESQEKEVSNYKFNIEENNQIARKQAAAGAVLLKNDNALPLKKGEKIAVIGKLADKLRYQGGGSSHILPTKLTSFVDALKENNQPFKYADGYSLKGDGYKKSLIKEACKVAQTCDKVLVFVGLTDAYESEGYDRPHIDLPKSHNILIEELLKVNKNINVILSVGSPVKFGSWEKDVKSILNLYLGGQAGGIAAYDLIFGDVNPSGKLPETFPISKEDYIGDKYFRMGPRTVEYREGIYVGYRYFDSAKKDVLFPFGYGLSYTTFEYSDINVSKETITEDEEIEVSFKIKNTGNVDGAEVAQLYVKDVESTLYRPEKELKGFKKVFLKAGEEQTVSIKLDSRAFSYYNVEINNWHIENGDFNILIGASSRDIKLSKTIYVKSNNPDAPIPNYIEAAPVYYSIDKATDIPKEQFEAIYGDKMPNNEEFKIGEIDVTNSIGQCKISKAGRRFNKVIMLGAKIVASSAENPAMIINSVIDLPLRAMTAMTGGLVPEKSLLSLVDMMNGKKGGFRGFIKGFFSKK